MCKWIFVKYLEGRGFTLHLGQLFDPQVSLWFWENGKFVTTSEFEADYTGTEDLFEAVVKVGIIALKWESE